MRDTETSQTQVSPLDSPTMSVRQVAKLLGICPEAAYDGVARGDIPSIRIGRKILIPTAKIAAMLGIESEAGPADEE